MTKAWITALLSLELTCIKRLHKKKDLTSASLLRFSAVLTQNLTTQN